MSAGKIGFSFFAAASFLATAFAGAGCSRSSAAPGRDAVYGVAIEAVRGKLPVPSSAHFPPLSDVRIEDEGDGRFVVSGSLEAQAYEPRAGVRDTRYVFWCRVREDEGGGARALGAVVMEGTDTAMLNGHVPE